MLKQFLTPSNVTGLNVNDGSTPEQSLHQIKHFSNVQGLCVRVSDVTMNRLLCCCASSLAFRSVPSSTRVDCRGQGSAVRATVVHKLTCFLVAFSILVQGDC